MSKSKVKDIQNEKAPYPIPVDRVGIKEIEYPIVVYDKEHKKQPTVATVSMGVDLPCEFRGTHMSRFIEVLNNHRGMITMKNIRIILEEIKSKMKAKRSYIEIKFPYFVEKLAPITKIESIMGYKCKFEASLEKELDLICSVSIPVMTLCPCSKEISKYNAHNQRGIVTVHVRMVHFVWIEDIIEIVESSCSSPLYSLLKREDEKFVTETSYEKPLFVEDVVREVANKLEKISDIIWYKVEVENMESIHNHNAYAMIERRKVNETDSTDSLSK